MADSKHLNLLYRGVEKWNQWREENPEIKPNLLKAKLKGLNLKGINFSNTNLSQADLRLSLLWAANLKGSNLTKAKLVKAYLVQSKMNKANLYQAKLCGADFRNAKMQGCCLCEANLQGANFSGANLINANLSGSYVYGVSAWDLIINKNTIQADLIVTLPGKPKITVNNLEIAQFLHLILNNSKIRDIIDTITSKMVLILGRFTPERKSILDTIRNELKKYNYIPVLFDFEKPNNRNTLEVITTIARLAKFIIADITSPKSIPQELISIVPNLPSVPIQPLLLYGETVWGMYDAIKTYPWVKNVLIYKDQEDLLNILGKDILQPIEQMIRKSTKV